MIRILTHKERKASRLSRALAMGIRRKSVHEFHLDNPAMHEHAFKLMCSEALRSQRAYHGKVRGVAGSPGDVIRQHMRDKSVKEAAEGIGISVSLLHHKLANRSRITSPLAWKLGKYFGTPSLFWVETQRKWDESEEKDEGIWESRHGDDLHLGVGLVAGHTVDLPALRA